MAIEAKRGCGYRKVGGLYLVGDEPNMACGKLPLELVACSTCGGGIHQTRGWTWIDPARLFADATCFERLYNCDVCPNADFELMGRSGLLWIGKQHYPTPEHFALEAHNMGISRRIPAVPNDFVAGQTWVFLAHPEAVTGRDAEGEQVMLPAVFQVFRPKAVEMIVTETEAKDQEAMDALAKRGITPVPVPDDDPDHQP